MATNFGPEIKSAMGNPEIRGPMSGQAGRVEKPSAPTGRVRVQTKPRMPSLGSGSGETAADMARDKARGIAEGSPQDMKIDAMKGNQAAAQTHAQNNAMMGNNAMAHAAGIAHAILGNRSLS